MSGLILHITSPDAWDAARAAGKFTADTLESEGFIHCSTPAQVLRVANMLFSGQHGLILLVIDSLRLASELRWEPGVDLASERFPHIYGPINLEAVVDVLAFEPQADGSFVLPSMPDKP